ncbi:MAG: metal ABC transporter permease [Desulfuromonadales bacterium]|nr:metal ABC transporter permease [Desulfuromonadales bacterium]
MTLSLIFDPLFHLPFLVGLVLAPLVATLGAYLRLREEWFASLAFAQVAAAGGVLSAMLYLPLIPAALATAALASIGKGVLQKAGNENYAILFLLGWSVALLGAANSPHGEMLGKAVMDGQIYFVGGQHLTAALLLLLATGLLLPWLSPRLLMAQLFPDHFSANHLAGWRYHLAFDLLVVAGIAVTTTAVGVMGSFALVFIPPWIAFRLAVGWRSVLLVTAALALGAYLFAFAAAIVLNQPFGPVLVCILVVMTPLRFLQPRQHRLPLLRS